jgi:hypothetical protein
VQLFREALSKDMAKMIALDFKTIQKHFPDKFGQVVVAFLEVQEDHGADLDVFYSKNNYGKIVIPDPELNFRFLVTLLHGTKKNFRGIISEIQRLGISAMHTTLKEIVKAKTREGDRAATEFYFTHHVPSKNKYAKIRHLLLNSGTFFEPIWYLISLIGSCYKGEPDLLQLYIPSLIHDTRLDKTDLYTILRFPEKTEDTFREILEVVQPMFSKGPENFNAPFFILQCLPLNDRLSRLHWGLLSALDLTERENSSRNGRKRNHPLQILTEIAKCVTEFPSRIPVTNDIWSSTYLNMYDCLRYVDWRPVRIEFHLQVHQHLQ